MDRIKRKMSKKQKLAVILISVVVLVGIYLGVAFYRHLFPFTNKTPTYEPGTHVVNKDKSDAEKQAIDNLKNNPQDKTKNSQTDTPPAPTVNQESGKKEANVLITNVGVQNGTVSASGFASNVVESEGTCTYTFTNGSNRVIKTSNVLPNPTSTTCATVNFPASELPVAGTWSVVLSYSSPESAGSSAAKEFQR
jgi:hypothetical protein